MAFIMSEATKRNIEKIHKRKLEQDRRTLFVMASIAAPRPCVKWFNSKKEDEYRHVPDTSTIDFSQIQTETDPLHLLEIEWPDFLL